MLTPQSLLALNASNSPPPRENLHICPNVNITSWDFRGSNENVPTETAGTVNPHGVLAAMGRGAVEGDLSALVTVGGVGGPCRLVPAALKVLRDLGKGEGKEGEGENGGATEHF